MNQFERGESESINDYKQRLYNNKLLYRLTWSEIADLLNYEQNTNFTAKKYMNECAKMKQEQYDAVDEAEDLVLIAKTVKQETAQFRRSANKKISQLARNINFAEIMQNTVDSMNDKKLLDVKNVIKLKGDKEAIACISDWHLGACINSYWNVFNVDVCKERVTKYLVELIDTCKENKVNKIHVFNLGDLICGRIHEKLEIESAEEVGMQVLHVSEILAEFLVELANNGFQVEYYDCYDNHSRFEPNKDKAVDVDTFVLFIRQYLQTRYNVYNNPRIHFNDNVYSNDIITANILGWNIAGVHGHRDKQRSAVRTLQAFTRTSFDLLLTAHEHHFSAEETNNCMLISNPSLMGTDQYAESLRLSSKPAQNIVIVSKKSPYEVVKKVDLD